MPLIFFCCCCWCCRFNTVEIFRIREKHTHKHLNNTASGNGGLLLCVSVKNVQLLRSTDSLAAMINYCWSIFSVSTASIRFGSVQYFFRLLLLKVWWIPICSHSSLLFLYFLDLYFKYAFFFGHERGRGRERQRKFHVCAKRNRTI